jgi:hypothetical protein
MAITMRDFAPAIGFLCEMLPMQRALSDEAIAMAWETIPNVAKLQLTPEMLGFAVKQRLMDPTPPKDQAPHIALLRYVFPVERTTKREHGDEVHLDRVILDNGPRTDIAQRMAAPERFHDPGPVRHEHAPPPERPRLPGGGSNGWHPSQMTPNERRRHLERIAADVERVIASGGGAARSDEQLAQGLAWFRRALQGFWGLQCDDGGIAAAWIAANPADARALVRDALEAGGAAAEPAGGLAGEVLAW